LSGSASGRDNYFWPTAIITFWPSEGARILLAEGVDPETSIVTGHVGDDFDAMRSTIGEAAKWTVEENEKIGPRFIRWKAFPRSDVQGAHAFKREAAIQQRPTQKTNETGQRGSF
jgi:hypothetical protein